jgi:hypothetical protein
VAEGLVWGRIPCLAYFVCAKKKKKPKDLNSKKDNSSHTLIAINSSLDAWIVDSGASHHMVASKAIYFSLDACKGPPILMGDNSYIEVTDKGRIELIN